MGREEQNEEREVLSAIFPDEITDLEEHSFRISIALDESIQDGDHPPPTLLLTVALPEPYPDAAPSLDLAAPPNAPKHPFLDVAEDKAALLSALADTVQDNLGMQMIFTLVSTLKDSAELLVAERRSARERLKEVEAQKVEEEENRKFHGEKVTRDSFLRWRERFRREMEEEEARKREEKEAEDRKKRSGASTKEERMTGRMLWERGLAGKADDEEGQEDGLDLRASGLRLED